MNTGRVFADLTADEQEQAMALLRPTDMRTTNVLLTARYRARQAGLANREVTTPGTARLAFARYLREHDKLADA